MLNTYVTVTVETVLVIVAVATIFVLVNAVPVTVTVAVLTRNLEVQNAFAAGRAANSEAMEPKMPLQAAETDDETARSRDRNTNRMKVGEQRSSLDNVWCRPRGGRESMVMLLSQRNVSRASEIGRLHASVHRRKPR